MRRCKAPGCGNRLPKLKDSDRFQKIGSCNLDCFVAWQKSNRQEVQQIATRARDKEHRRQKRESRGNDLGHQKELTQAEFNRMIRLLDRGKTCPTCGEPLVAGSYDAGHVRTVAACPSLRYDARACFGQCRSCNGSGTIRKRVRKTQEAVSGLYEQWVKDSLGEEHHLWLYGPHEPKHYTCDDLKAMRKEFAAEARRLERGEKPSRDWRKLDADSS